VAFLFSCASMSDASDHDFCPSLFRAAHGVVLK
jgi:hypothetical protein